jgi:two-component system, CitB family, response regulator DctR
MSSWRVLIVEDDPEVAYLHRALVMRVSGFEVVGTATNNQDALAEIKRTRPHLLLLDLTLRGADGTDLLRHLRAAESPIEVIAVTASRNARIVRSLVHLGVIDYLVKPFTAERLYRALAAFRERMGMLGTSELTQREVDALRSNSRSGRRWLPKGLSESALDRVRAALRESEGPVSAAHVAEVTGMARVTVRRYLEYLVSAQQAGSRAQARGPGRPSKLYWSEIDPGWPGGLDRRARP